MAYIDKDYYGNEFGGQPIEDNDFPRLADFASEVVYDICRVKPIESDLVKAEFKKAVAYEVEFLSEQGGIDAILGFSASSMAGGSESLGDYSVSGGSSAQAVLTTPGGIPVSPMAIMLLRRIGLMSKWAYASKYRR